MSGGQAIESAARKATDPSKFPFESSMTRHRNCQFSFAGIWTTSVKHILRREKELNIDASVVIPDAYDLCAALQMTVVKHMCLRTQRAMEFIDKMNLIPQDKRTLVRSILLSLIFDYFDLTLVVFSKCRWYPAEWHVTIS